MEQDRVSFSRLDLLGIDIQAALELPKPLRRKIQAFLLSSGCWLEAEPLIITDYYASPLGFNERIVMGKLSARTGDFELAEEICSGLEAEMPGNPSVIAARGDLYLEQGNAAAAIGCYYRLLEIDANNWEAWMLIARACQRENRWEQADEYSRNAVSAFITSGKRPTEKLPNSLLRILERQAAGCGRSKEAQAIRLEIEKRIQKSAQSLRNLIDAFQRGLKSDWPPP